VIGSSPPGGINRRDFTLLPQLTFEIRDPMAARAGIRSRAHSA
jgi:hypothetical protein